MHANANVTLISNCCLYPYYIFIRPLSMQWSIYIKTFCKAFYILEHFKFAAPPGAGAEAGDLCRCHGLTDYQSPKITAASGNSMRALHFAAHLLFHTLSVWAESIGQQKLPTRGCLSVSLKRLRLDVCYYKSSVTAAALSALCCSMGWWGLGAVWEQADGGYDKIKNIE